MKRLDPEVEFAELPHRLVSHQQLRLEGLSTRQIEFRVAGKLLVRVIPGVYSIGPPKEEFLTKAIAVCLRCPGAFLSGAAAARYWALRRGVGNLYEFTVPYGRRPRGLTFAQFRYAQNVRETDIFHAPDGLRVSGAARAVFEAASRLDEAGLRSMIHDGLHRNLFTMTTLQELGTHLCRRGRRGTRLFETVVGQGGFDVPVHSEDEMILLTALHTAGLHDASAQYPVRLGNGYTVHLDIGVPSARVGLEVDGPTHDDRIAVHRDKSRDLQVAVQGWQVLRITADEVRSQLPVLVASILHICRARATSDPHAHRAG